MVKQLELEWRYQNIGCLPVDLLVSLYNDHPQRIEEKPITNRNKEMTEDYSQWKM